MQTFKVTINTVKTVITIGDKYSETVSSITWRSVVGEPIHFPLRLPML